MPIICDLNNFIATQFLHENICTAFFVREKIIFSPSGENLGEKLIPEKFPKTFSFFVFKSNK